MKSEQSLRGAADAARTLSLRMAHRAKAAHLGSSLSAIEIFTSILGSLKGSDRIVVSKGHAAIGMYACLHQFGKINKESIEQYGSDGAELFGHVSEDRESGIDFSTGSLGHGLPYALGRAMGARLNDSETRFFVVMSDGEMNEGTTWESALLGAHHRLSNLTVIIDRNRLQSIGGTEETLKLEPLGEKWKAFGWNVLEIDGHSIDALLESIELPTTEPKVIIANTIKGKGVSFMEGDNLWHYRPPTNEQLEFALNELGQEK